MKKTIALLASLLIIAGTLPVSAEYGNIIFLSAGAEETEYNEVYTEQLTDTIEYTYFDGTIVISGTGDIPDYEDYSPIDYIDTVKVIISDGITSIGEKTFTGMSFLEEIEIPNSVTRIGKNAFSFCESLKNITIPDGVKSIESETFYFCNSLENLSLPDSVEYIGESAFMGCESLFSIDSLANVSEIASYAFFDCTSLNMIEISPKTEFIGDYAFTNCDNIRIHCEENSYARLYAKMFNLPLADENGGDYIPEPGTTLLRSNEGYANYSYKIDSDGTVTIYGKGEMGNFYWSSPFEKKGEIRKVIFADGVTNIGTDLLDGCYNLKEVVLPDSLKAIDPLAFYNCYSLAKINIPESVTYIGGNAFGNTRWLMEKQAKDPMVIVNDILIDANNCEDCIIVPDGVKIISEFTADGVDSPCNSVEYIQLPESVIRIDSYAFRSLDNLSKINIPVNVEYIGLDVFEGCNNVIVSCNPESYAYEYCMKQGIITTQDTIAFGEKNDTVTTTIETTTAVTTDVTTTHSKLSVTSRNTAYTTTEIMPIAYNTIAENDFVETTETNVNLLAETIAKEENTSAEKTENSDDDRENTEDKVLPETGIPSTLYKVIIVIASLMMLLGGFMTFKTAKELSKIRK